MSVRKLVHFLWRSSDLGVSTISGLPEAAMHLAAQDVEIIGRGGRHADLHIVLGAKLQITLQAGGGMFRPLAFIAMRQQQGQARHAQPFHFAAGDELVHHDLRAIGEVAELGFPQHQRLGLGGGIAIFKAQHRFFRQQGVDHLEAALVFADMLQREIAFLGLLVDQGGMALAEGAARRILARQADIEAFVQQGAEGQRLRRWPSRSLRRSRTSWPWLPAGGRWSCAG